MKLYHCREVYAVSIVGPFPTAVTNLLDLTRLYDSLSFLIYCSSFCCLILYSGWWSYLVDVGTIFLYSDLVWICSLFLTYYLLAGISIIISWLDQFHLKSGDWGGLKYCNMLFLISLYMSFVGLLHIASEEASCCILLTH